VRVSRASGRSTSVTHAELRTTGLTGRFRPERSACPAGRPPATDISGSYIRLVLRRWLSCPRCVCGSVGRERSAPAAVGYETTLDDRPIVNDPVSLRVADREVQARTPEVVFDATFGGFWAVDALEVAGVAVNLAHPLAKQGFSDPKDEDRRTRCPGDRRAGADTPAARGLDRPATGSRGAELVRF
jgi:hypothetical protein